MNLRNYIPEKRKFSGILCFRQQRSRRRRTAAVRRRRIIATIIPTDKKTKIAWNCTDIVCFYIRKMIEFQSLSMWITHLIWLNSNIHAF